MSRKIFLCLFWLWSISLANGQVKKVTILLVGTAHHFQDSLKHRQKFPELVQKLLEFKPELVCQEAIPVWDNLSLEQVRQQNLKMAAALRAEKNIDLQKAQDETTHLLALLARYPDDLVARSRLANMFYSQHDFANAHYHWHILQKAILQDSTRISPALKQSFSSNYLHVRSYEAKRDTEEGNIIFPFAAQASFNQLQNIDDRADDAQFKKLGKHTVKRLILNLKVFKAARTYKNLLKETSQAEQEGQLMQKINSMEFQQVLVQNIDNLPTKWVRSKKAKQLQEVWYKRNERMAERIAMTLRANPAAQRAVVFFGAAHVDFVARYLAQNPAFEIITLPDFLKEFK